jgi:SAM-dependent methyltransferase
MPLAFARDESHPMVDALLRSRVPRWRELNRAIDERDDMLDFAMQLFHQDRDAALASYFQNALEQFALVRHIARWRWSGDARPARMLDFASGYGRLTRLLVHEHLADAITVSDILEGGMHFQAEQFGVRTILSRTQPDEFSAPERYDLIFVASLFTHLPPATFTPWLRRLAEHLAPHGLLIFSVHDEHLAPEKFEGGISFESRSESRVLDVEDYGSTWVTEEFVREQVRSIGSDWACVRLPRALSDWQDVYVISPSPIENARPRVVPKGFLEEPQLGADHIRIWGWATTIDAPPDRVEIRIDDQVVASTAEFTPRADVRDWFGTDSARNSGWECRVPHAAVRSFRYQVATISAFSRDHEERILFLGTIDSLLGTVARERAQALSRQLGERQHDIAALREQLAISDHRRRTLEQQMEAMKQSRFWKARDRWFALKRAAGLTEEA